MTKRHPALEERPFLEPIITGRRRYKYFVIVALWSVAAWYFWSWWAAPGVILEPIMYTLVTFGLVWLWAMQLFFVVVFLHAKRSVAPDPEPGRWRVAMITTKTPAEPFDVVRLTLEAMLAQDYPHDTWLADEAPDPETLAWCEANGVKVSTRHGIAEYHRTEWPRRARCKEGNLSYFYDHWGYRDYDIVSQLDADHVPQPGYLKEILRPFHDAQVGYVSAPSVCASNAAHSWAARTRLYFEAGFHGVFQTGYSGLLTPMCIGSHYAVRTRALKAAGGLGPELAEDHSTSMLISAAGWRGVHAIDAAAIGQGPETPADLVTQEFQWSRSLVTLLLRHTIPYLKHLPWRLRFLFVLCQTWYALFAFCMTLMYLVPIVVLLTDTRFAGVSFPGFLGHILPATAVMTAFAYFMKSDNLFRPSNAKVLAWEKALFVMLQWPWVLWGCLMAFSNWITGRMVDFRITPKGKSVESRLPIRLYLLYFGLILGALSPVLFVDEVSEVRGFYMLSLVNATFYAILLTTAVVQQYRSAIRAHAERVEWPVLEAAGLSLSCALVLMGFSLRGAESLHALAVGLEVFQISEIQYIASGAGSGGIGEFEVIFFPRWFE